MDFRPATSARHRDRLQGRQRTPYRHQPTPSDRPNADQHSLQKPTKETEGLSKGYDVIFESGDKIEFDRSGNWEEVDCNSAGVPTAILPAAVKQFVATKHKDAKVMKISKDRNSTEVELSNGWELEFDKNGKLLDADRNMPGD